MPRSLPLSSLLLICVGLAPWSSARALEHSTLQEEKPATGRTVVRTDYDQLLKQMVEHHGGVERLDRLRTLRFSIVPVEHRADDDGVRTEHVLEPLTYELEFGSETRRLRIEEELEGKRFVKLIGPEGISVYLDGELQSIPELSQVAGEQAAVLLRHLDISYGLISGHLFGDGQTVRTRDGVDYRAVRARFDPSRQIAEEVMVYVHPTHFRVERYDLYDGETKRRKATMVLGDPVDLDGLPFASRVSFLNRERETVLEWRFEDVEADVELAPERFEAP